MCCRSMGRLRSGPWLWSDIKAPVGASHTTMAPGRSSLHPSGAARCASTRDWPGYSGNNEFIPRKLKKS